MRLSINLCSDAHEDGDLLRQWQRIRGWVVVDPAARAKVCHTLTSASDAKTSRTGVKRRSSANRLESEHEHEHEDEDEEKETLLCGGNIVFLAV